MSVNLSNPLLYEHLSLIIDEYERNALNTASRESILAISNASLYSMDSMLASSQTTLESVRAGRSTEISGTAEEDLVNIDLDADLGTLFGGNNNPVSNYLNECLGCNLRVKFDWQLKPLNLLGGIQDIIDGVKVALDGFSLQLDPLKNLNKVCELLNNLKGLCLPDIIISLLSLKMLLKRYLNDAFSIKLDWTTIVGPLLKAIVEGIAKLLETMATVLLSPLDCTVSSMLASKELQKQLESFDFELSSSVKWSLTSTGASASGNTKLEQIMKEPGFNNAGILDKMIVSVNTAKSYLSDLISQITNALRSVQTLVSGGLSLQLGNFGIILFLQDLISLIMVIINLMKEHRGVTDWCKLLEQNPEILESALRARFDPGINISSNKEGILSVYKGPNLITEIKTCTVSRSASDNDAIQNWIKELEAKGI